MKKFITMLLVVAALSVVLIGCKEKQSTDTATPESNTVEEATEPAAEPVANTEEASTEEVAEPATEATATTEATMVGTVNRKSVPLVILDESGQYLKFNTGDLSLDGIEEGDDVEITYTGTLTEDSTDLVAISIVKK